MKVKARDIIEGWPKGRSTSAFGPRSMAYLDPFSLLLNRPPRDKFIDEATRNAEYHAAQQRLVDAYIESRRVGEYAGGGRFYQLDCVTHPPSHYYI